MVRTCAFYSSRKFSMSDLPLSALIFGCSNTNKIFHKESYLKEIKNAGRRIVATALVVERHRLLFLNSAVVLDCKNWTPLIISHV